MVSMQGTSQSAGQSVLEHGLSVRDFFLDLRDHVTRGIDLRHKWRLPAWIYEPSLWESLLDDSVLFEYQVFHDCGKPACRIVDSEGRVHYPNHARVSSAIWATVGGSEVACRLMAMDMDIHLISASDIPEFARKTECASLLITSLCEIHSNSTMFGGLESISFKSKFKHIDRRGKQIIRK